MKLPYINIHTHHLQIIENVISVANIYPQQNIPKNQYFSIGIHPWHLQEDVLKTHLLNLEKNLKNPKCIAIGECGLDKICKTNFSLQMAVFKEHIHLSEKYKKPLIIHCVKAFNEIIKIKKEIHPTQIWMIHGFNKKYEIVQQLHQNNILTSFGKALLTNTSTQNSFIKTPLHKMFLETDDENISIKDIYKKAAELKQLSIEELIVHLHSNFKMYFLQNGNLDRKNGTAHKK